MNFFRIFGAKHAPIVAAAAPAETVLVSAVPRPEAFVPADLPVAHPLPAPSRRKWWHRLGPGLITGASDDDPERHRHLFPGRRAVRLRPGLDHAVQLPADGGDPGDQRPDRPRHRPRHRRQHPAPLLALAASSARRGLLLVANSINLGADLGAMGAALNCWSAGRACSMWRPSACWACCSRSSCATRAMSRVLKWLTPVAVRLCGDRLDRATSRGARLMLGDLRAAVSADARLPDRARRRARHDDQPVPVLLAGGSRRSRSSGRRRRRSRCATPERTRRTNFAGSRSIRWSGWAFSNMVALFIILTTAATLHAARHHQHPDLRPGRRGAAADRGRFRLHALRRRDHRHRAAGGAGAGRVRRLCGRRGVRLADGLAAASARGQGLLRHDRCRDADRRGHELHRRSIRSRRCFGARSSTAWSPCR